MFARPSLGAAVVGAVGRTFGHPPAASGTTDEEPIRAELFGIERLEQHAESLAAAQKVSSRPARDNRLEARLLDNERALRTAYLVTTAAVRDARSITPSADWLVDNFHVVQEQVRAIRIDLPPGFQKKLPKLLDGPFKGYPRVFGLSWAIVAHTDSRFDPHILQRFLHAYQRVQTLTIGELWAVAIALRVVLVENLRRLAENMVSDQRARQAANSLADRLLGGSEKVAEKASAVLERVGTPLSTAFAVQLVRRLREEDPRVAPAVRWLDATLAAQGATAEGIVRLQQQREGAANVTIRNIITSMRLMSAIDWRELFESVSTVDAILRADSNFADLDFPTRELYRHAIEEVALGSSHSETDVTRLALEAAKHAENQTGDSDAASARKSDPGYYLIATGRAGFETSIGSQATIRRRLVRANAALGVSGYVGVLAAATALILVLVLAWDRQWNTTWDCIGTRPPRPPSGVGCCHGVGEPRCHQSFRRHHAAGPRACPWRAVRPAHNDRHADAADLSGWHCRAGQAAGGSSSC